MSQFQLQLSKAVTIRLAVKKVPGLIGWPFTRDHQQSSIGGQGLNSAVEKILSWHLINPGRGFPLMKQDWRGEISPRETDRPCAQVEASVNEVQGKSFPQNRAEDPFEILKCLNGIRRGAWMAEAPLGQSQSQTGGNP